MRKVLAATLMWAATATGLSAQAPATDQSTSGWRARSPASGKCRTAA